MRTDGTRDDTTRHQTRRRDATEPKEQKSPAEEETTAQAENPKAKEGERKTCQRRMSGNPRRDEDEEDGKGKGKRALCEQENHATPTTTGESKTRQTRRTSGERRKEGRREHQRRKERKGRKAATEGGEAEREKGERLEVEQKE